MKIERCFRIRGQVNKIYTVYEVHLEDIKLSLCSSLLISAPYNFFSNPQSFSGGFVAVSADDAPICAQDVLHPALLPYPFVYSPITLRNSRHESCSATLVFHTCTLPAFHHCQPPPYFCLKGDTSEQRSLGDWQGEVDRDSVIQPQMPTC